MVTGEFVDVHKGTWKGRRSDLDVVVKSLKSNAPQEEKIKLLQEAVIMGQFHHPNILQFYGVVNKEATVSASTVIITSIPRTEVYMCLNCNLIYISIIYGGPEGALTSSLFSINHIYIAL